jgi:hypothetical protein
LFTLVFKNIINELFSNLIKKYPDFFNQLEKCSLQIKSEDLQQLSNLFETKSLYYKQVKDLLAFHEAYKQE